MPRCAGGNLRTAGPLPLAVHLGIPWVELRTTLILEQTSGIILEEEPCTAIDGDVQALNRLLERLKEAPTLGERHPTNPPFIPILPLVLADGRSP